MSQPNEMEDLLKQFDEIVTNFEKQTDEKLELERAVAKRKFRQWLAVPIAAVVVLLAVLGIGIYTATALNSTQHQDQVANCMSRNQDRADLRTAFNVLFADLNHEFVPPSAPNAAAIFAFEHQFDSRVTVLLKPERC